DEVSTRMVPPIMPAPAEVAPAEVPAPVPVSVAPMLPVSVTLPDRLPVPVPVLASPEPVDHGAAARLRFGPDPSKPRFGTDPSAPPQSDPNGPFAVVSTSPIDSIPIVVEPPIQSEAPPALPTVPSKVRHPLFWP